MLSSLQKTIGIPQERFCVYLENIGNTVSNGIQIALCDAQRHKLLYSNVLLRGFGVGYFWGQSNTQY